MTAVIHTPSGTITSVHRFGTKQTSVSWRTDGPTAHVWPSVEAATAWMDLVWSLDPKEKARCGWTVRPVVVSHCANPSTAGDACGECAGCATDLQALKDLAASQGG